jgi:hypothetical protein
MAVPLVCLLAMALAGCGAIGHGATATATAVPTQITYHLDASVRRNCRWQNNGPATCEVYVTNKADSNFTFHWQATSSPLGASFSPASGSLTPGQTSHVITVISPTTICPITFRFVDTQHQLEADSQFNPCTG